MINNKIITIERYLMETQPVYARGDLTAVLYDLAFAAKIIAAETRKAGLLDIVGFADNVNVQGEEQRKLDVFSDQVIVQINDHTGRLCAMVSEEREDVIPIPEKYRKGSYILVYDPLDGSTNIDTNISIGTIFGIYRTLDENNPGQMEDCLQPGKDLVAAGYILYGTSTMLVYSAGKGVHGFTLDPEWGEFILSHENIRIPEEPHYFSFNHGAANRWPKGMSQYVDWLRDLKKPALSQRYIGSMVADFHRNMIYGGVFGYPSEPTKPDGKIRLLYEAAPLAYLAEQAGGYGSDGSQSLLEIKPTDIHQRVPVFIGNRDLVEKAEEFITA
ncbi:MAG: class 1 fructose-bisphosphatase [Anaerolineales bacterium]|jgi:fructose-1,6-bisphosphatase I